MNRDASSGRRRPSFFLLGFWLLLIAGIVWLHLADPAGDAGFINALSQILAIPLIFSMWLWVVLRGPLPKGLRRLIAWGSVLGVGSFMVLMRHTGFSGSMTLEFVQSAVSIS